LAWSHFLQPCQETSVKTVGMKLQTKESAIKMEKHELQFMILNPPDDDKIS